MKFHCSFEFPMHHFFVEVFDDIWKFLIYIIYKSINLVLFNSNIHDNIVLSYISEMR